jgi:hypothetical protein
MLSVSGRLAITYTTPHLPMKLEFPVSCSKPKILKVLAFKEEKCLPLQLHLLEICRKI